MKTPTHFEWDENKAASNLVKHKVSFPFAARVFLDPDAVLLNTFRPQDGEDRSKMVGRIGDKLYAVVFVMVGDACRIISARRTNAKEDRSYGR